MSTRYVGGHLFNGSAIVSTGQRSPANARMSRRFGSVDLKEICVALFMTTNKNICVPCVDFNNAIHGAALTSEKPCRLYCP